MRNIRTVGCVLIILSLLLAFPVRIKAEEVEVWPEWENTDWAQFDWRLLDDAMIRQSLAQWLRDEADLHDVVMVCGYNQYEAFYVPAEVVTDCFLFSPETFLRVLALEEKNVQERVISAVVYSLDAEPQEVIAVLETVTLSDTDSAATYALLREMISLAESAYQVEINNPKTADPLIVVRFLLPLSGACLAILLRRRKYCA